MKKRFLITLACGAALGLLIVSGLSCISFTTYQAQPISEWLPPTESGFESYITPECPSVQETLHDILGDPPYVPSQTGFDNIRDWVATNIDYISNAERWGKDYWQTPEETLLYRTGDCKDFATLLCSLLRAYGIPAEQVYVVFGVDDEPSGHAFLIEDWNHDGEWQRIEPQAPAQFSSWRSWFGLLNADSRLDKYEITTAFNDLYYYDRSFPWDTNQANISTMSKIATGVGDIAGQLLKLAEYLLGLLFK
ncbi:MAG TPA: transglutaminase-like domain-containing protein [Dehalococcoidia bacterium]|nr:transglutaminase-like domain-containing protein [Dehalococcoidia bacterium]